MRFPGRIRKTGRGGLSVLAIASLGLLPGCLESIGSTMQPLVTKLGISPASTAPAPDATVPGEVAETSPLIAELMARDSILPPGGAFARVADAVLAASSGAAAAELRMARLESEAKEKNWLPELGPEVTLTSLGGLASRLVLEQALFDNGARKAERRYAAADVEIAAVNLSDELNGRVYEGLSHHIAAERARAQAAVAERAVARLREFAGIMGQRVEGGLSDNSEAQLLQQKLTEMEATLSADREAEARALADLRAMAAGGVASVTGLDSLPTDPGAPLPLSVLKARAEGAQDVAAADMEEAAMLPGLSAEAGLDAGGLAAGLRLGAGGLLNFGNGAKREALEATDDLVARREAEAREEAQRDIVAMQGEIEGLQARQSEGAAVLAQTEQNLGLYTEQYKVGRRSLLELVGQYDSYARQERDQAVLSHEILLLRLQIARDRGVLVDGARM